MTRSELERAIGLRDITTAELREAEKLHKQGRSPSYIRGWLGAARVFRKDGGAAQYFHEGRAEGQ